jgi:hypothetical protein
MEFRDGLRGSWIFGSLSARVYGLSQGGRAGALADSLKRHRRKIQSVALLLAALTFGIWAHDLAETEALSSWLHTHPPSEQMWRHALLSRGMRALEEPHALQKAAKSLPTLVDADGTVWLSADAGWIAVFGRQANGLAQAIYCLECEHPPLGWSPAGNGWEAFDPVLAQVDQLISQRKPQQKALKRAVPRDPREIVY